MKKNNSEITRNIDVHNLIYKKYESRHPEIYNSIEQKRLAGALLNASNLVETNADKYIALDVGCGAGNLTNHLLNIGMHVVSADVSTNFLQLIKERFKGKQIETLKLNGTDFSNIPSGSFDMVCIYSVLHHIPDYLFIIKEMARVCKKGGIIYIDHEHTDEYWQGNSIYIDFIHKANTIDWKKYLVMSNYITKIKRIFNKRFSSEGDIHVFSDDHIEWVKIDSVLTQVGMKCIENSDYLLFKGNYKKDVYLSFYSKCSDMRYRIYKKLS